MVAIAIETTHICLTNPELPDQPKVAFTPLFL